MSRSSFQTYASAVSRQALPPSWELSSVTITASCSSPCISPALGPLVHIELENILQISEIVWGSITTHQLAAAEL